MNFGIEDSSYQDNKVHKYTPTEKFLSLNHKHLTKSKIKSVYDLLEETKCLSLGIDYLDKALGGGFKSAQITEIFGKSSTGKTQFALFLCLRAQLPIDKGGLNMDSIYISTEHRFVLKRFYQMVDEHLKLNSSTLNRTDFGDRVHSIFAPGEFLYELIEDKIEEVIVNNKIGLIVLDSIAGGLRPLNFKDKNEQTTKIGLLLKKLAYKYSIIVVVVNQVSDVYNLDLVSEKYTFRQMIYHGVGGCSELGNIQYVPSMGVYWALNVHVRILLLNNRTTLFRHFVVLKSPNAPFSINKFTIKNSGIANFNF